MKQYAATNYSSLDFKQCYTVNTFHRMQDNGYPEWRSRTIQEVLVGIDRNGLRLRYPTRHKKVQRLRDASTDLKSLAALTIVGLVPLGVLADRLEEEFPQHSEAANLLREWERVKREDDQ
jgi:hypothetical protein